MKVDYKMKRVKTVRLLAVMLLLCTSLTSCASNNKTESISDESCISEISEPLKQENQDNTISSIDSIEPTYTYTDATGGIMLTGIEGAGSDVIIPDAIDQKAVVAIDTELFQNNIYIKKVTLPASLTKINSKTFSGCTSLSEVIFNNGLIAIESKAFADCYSLKEVEIPETVTSISSDAFDFDINATPDESEVSEVSEIPDVSEEPKSSDNYDETSQEESKEESKEESQEPVVSPNDGFILMYQSDPAYKNLPYGNYTVGSHGCGPSCMAMIITNLTDTYITPPEMCDWSYKKGYMVGAVGTSLALLPAAAKNWGVQCDIQYNYTAESIKSALKQGKLIIVDMGPGTFTIGGHFMILGGITAEGKIMIADSQRESFSNQLWDLSFLMSEMQTSKPIWVFTK